MSEAKVVICAVGDVAAFHDAKVPMFVHVQPILDAADVRFAQNERHYNSARVTPVGGFTEQVVAERAWNLKGAGFDVISFASNHCMDLGVEPMMETIEALRNLGSVVIGAGRDIDEARAPAVFQHGEIRIGFLAYCSVLRPGYQADRAKAGAAPMRAFTLYDQVDYQPGTPPRIRTFANEEDLAAVRRDVQKLRSRVDVLVVSFHWGLHFVHGAVADYERQVAHSVIDAGADVILGHHPHMLKGVEVFRGKPIFYSMGNFAFDLPDTVLDEWFDTAPHLRDVFKEQGWAYDDPDWSAYTFPPVARKSMIVRCTLTKHGLSRVAFVPVRINRNAQPVALRPDDAAFDEVLDYIQQVTDHAGFATQFAIADDEVVIELDDPTKESACSSPLERTSISEGDN